MKSSSNVRSWANTFRRDIMSSSNQVQSPSVDQLLAAVAQLSPQQRYELFNALALQVIDDAERRTVAVRTEAGQVIRVLVHPSKLPVIESEEERELRRKTQEQLAAAGDDLTALEWTSADEVVERIRSGTLDEYSRD
jgi:hypothetical protein